MQMKKRILCAALVFLLASGCGTGGAPSPSSGQEASDGENGKTAESARPAADGERIYSIPLGNGWFSTESWVIDRDGNEVRPKDEDADYTEGDLKDLATGEVRYRYRMREEIVRDKDGYARTHRMRSLYDLDGNTLLDWEDKSYSDAFGEYIIRQDARDGIVDWSEVPDDYHTSLYHVPTGTESHEGTCNVEKLNSGDFLLLDSKSTTLGVVNSRGEAISGFPMPKPYYNAYMRNGHLTANLIHPYEQTKDERGVEFLLDFKDGHFRELFSAEWLSAIYIALKGDYIAYHNGDDWGVLHPDGDVLFTSDGASIEYYDGGLAIVQTGSYRGADPVDASLVTAEHKELAGGFSCLRPVQIDVHDDDTPAEKFIGISGAKVLLLDRTGNVIASSSEIPELAAADVKSVNTLCDGLYTYYAETDEFYGHGLLGPDLEVLIPMGRYTSIDLAPGFYYGNEEWDKTAENALLRAGKEIGGSDEPGRTLYRMDILDHTGKLVADNISDVYDVGPDRIALRRGFYVGLMDWDGNWVAKRKIFTGFIDD